MVTLLCLSLYCGCIVFITSWQELHNFHVFPCQNQKWPNLDADMISPFRLVQLLHSLFKISRKSVTPQPYSPTSICVFRRQLLEKIHTTVKIINNATVQNKIWLNPWLLCCSMGDLFWSYPPCQCIQCTWECTQTLPQINPQHLKPMCPLKASILSSMLTPRRIFSCKELQRFIKGLTNLVQTIISWLSSRNSFAFISKVKIPV